MKTEETPEDRKVDDDEFLLALGIACETAGYEAVRSPDWKKAMQVEVTAAGFYARVRSLEERGKVEVKQEKRSTLLYGRTTLANVKLYWRDDFLKAKGGAK